MFNRNQTYLACFLSLVMLFLQMYVLFYLYQKNERPVYCLMVTGHTENRIPFAKTSIANFKSQTYLSKHLIILNQSESTLLDDDNDNILEVHISTESKTLGELRNISLQFVPPNAIWTTWDDDDWRHPTYIETMVNNMTRRNADFLMSQQRIEYNLKNGFAFKTSLRSGLMNTIFSAQNPNIAYEHVSTSEDVKVKSYAMKNLKTIVVPNDPKMYIRLIHDDNTSIYVKSVKNEIKDTKKNKDYFENELTREEKEYVDNIISKYYK
ncbi:hypothetical protein QKU58_gp140 [Pyramimonas orientalis virus]|uniref:Uncharacterized protein n=1 Tax=Pyramimonas orientalis virus 01B TaxID=3134525 RepID=A0A7M3UNE2_9VIRU|nr:hypothetical protein QKU58_gp140 [Pyramimonas orientalis virus]QOI90191.1 hypothetical protein HWQ62_00054 [Pyramimonas orientalis virus]